KSIEAQLLDMETPLTLPLRCRSCGWEYHYEIDEILFSANEAVKNSASSEDSIDFLPMIRCKRCGAIEDYEIGAQAFLILTAEIMRAEILGRKRSLEKSRENRDDEDWTKTGRLRHLEVHMDDRIWPNRRAGYRHLLEKRDHHPDDPRVWVQLGNT